MSSRSAIPGGLPTRTPDIPADAVLIFVYAAFAATNMTIFQLNRIKRHFLYLPTVFLFGFSMSRIVTLSLRIAWATHPTKRGVSIAAQIFVSAGILILYVINLVLAQRILRARAAPEALKRGIGYVAMVFYAGVVGVLAMVITSTIIGGNTTNPNTLRIVRDTQLAAATYLFIFTTLPIFVLIAAAVHERRDISWPLHGSIKINAMIIALSSSIAILISGFKLGTAWMPPRPAAHPAWYQGKPAFYVFNFTCEILLLCVLTAARTDLRFRGIEKAEKEMEETKNVEAQIDSE